MKKYIRLFYSAAVLLLFITSCSKEQSIKPNNCITTDQEAYAEFASILSKAVYNDADLRLFLKQEALKQYDKDYDVFCQWSFEKPVEKGVSFRETLRRFDENNALDIIFALIPKMTILIPDWSWVDENCFNVNNWDTTDNDVYVGYQTEDPKCVVYQNGKNYETLEPGTFTSYPLLIVKDNERMVARPSTKGNNLEYDFSFDEFMF